MTLEVSRNIVVSFVSFVVVSVVDVKFYIRLYLDKIRLQTNINPRSAVQNCAECIRAEVIVFC